MLAQGLRPYYMLDSLQVHGLVKSSRHHLFYQILWNLAESIREEKRQMRLLLITQAQSETGQEGKIIGYSSDDVQQPQVWAWRKVDLNKSSLASTSDRFVSV